jgi:hypothetical protein
MKDTYEINGLAVVISMGCDVAIFYHIAKAIQKRR